MRFMLLVYYIFSAIAPNKKGFYRAITALAACYCIEILQLYNAPWLNALRATLPGRLVLGNGFLFSDLATYFIGIAAAFAIDNLWLCKDKLGE